MSGHRNHALQQAVGVILRGGVVAYPTDTVYGIGALALSTDAVNRVIALKGRDSTAPISVAVADWEMAELVIDSGACAGVIGRIRDLLPGPYTVLLPSRQGLPPPIMGPTGLVGLRIPANDLAISLSHECGPLTATSANVTGSNSPLSANEVELPVDYVLDGGQCRYGKESTVFDPIAMKVLRRGAGYEEVEAWLRTTSG